MNHIGLLLTRADLLAYCKDSVEELQYERKKLKDLEWLRDNTPPSSPNFLSILLRIINAQERVSEAKESLAVYKEQLDFMSIG